MRINGRVNWLRVLIASAILAALLLVTFRFHYFLNASTVYRIDALTGRFCQYPCTPEPVPPSMPPQTPTSAPFNIDQYISTQPLKDQLAYAAAQRMMALQATIPMSYANFGQRMSNSYLRLNHLIKQGFETRDGLLFVVYSTCASEGAGCERYDLGILDGDTLQKIWLPHKGGEWLYMELLSSSTGDTLIVRAQYPETQFAVSQHSIAQVPMTSVPSLGQPPEHQLNDGSTCLIDQKTVSPAFVWGVTPGGKRTQLISKAAFLTATNGAIKLSDVQNLYCTHFHEVDMLVAINGDTELTFVLAPGQFRLAAPGEPIILTKNHMVLRLTDVDKNGGVLGWEYAHITPK